MEAGSGSEAASGACPSARALAILGRFACMPPGWARAELEALLRARGAPVLDAHLAFEEALAGLGLDEPAPREGEPPRCRHGQQAGLLRLGPYELGTVVTARRRPRAAVRLEIDGMAHALLGSAPSGLFYLAPDGKVILVTGRRRAGFARSPWALVEKLARDMAAGEAPITAALPLAAGAVVAAALGLRAVPEASDEFSSAWEDGEVLVREGAILDPPPPITCVHLPGPAALSALVRACARHGLPLSVSARGLAPELAPRAAAPPLSPPPGAAAHGTRRRRERGAVWVQAGADGEEVVQAVTVFDGPVVEQTTFGPREAQILYARAEDGLGDRLSPEALAWLGRRAARLDPRDTAGREELSALLEAEGLPVFEAAFAFEEAFGGLSLDGPSARFGVYATIRDALERGEGSGFRREVGEGKSPSAALPMAVERDGVLYLAEDGSVHLDSWELGRVARLADGAATLLERRIRPKPGAGLPCCATVEAAVGEALARGLGLGRQDARSDSVESVWAGDDLVVHEERLESPRTHVFGGARRVAEALSAALVLAPEAGYEADLDVEDALAGREPEGGEPEGKEG